MLYKPRGVFTDFSVTELLACGHEQCPCQQVVVVVVAVVVAAVVASRLST
jgi:hypothetical protein